VVLVLERALGDYDGRYSADVDVEVVVVLNDSLDDNPLELRFACLTCAGEPLGIDSDEMYSGKATVLTFSVQLAEPSRHGHTVDEVP